MISAFIDTAIFPLLGTLPLLIKIGLMAPYPNLQKWLQGFWFATFLFSQWQSNPFWQQGDMS